MSPRPKAEEATGARIENYYMAKDRIEEFFAANPASSSSVINTAVAFPYPKPARLIS
jgi:hypothetical protein